MTFVSFLCAAKRATYASQGEANEELLQDGAKRLTFRKDTFTYSDTYYGSERFSGIEIVHKDTKPYWSMTYYGLSLTDIDPKQLYTFLQKALQQVPEQHPFRGPSFLKEEDWEYTNTPIGDIDSFTGTETIYHKGKKVFQLTYQGGLIR